MDLMECLPIMHKALVLLVLHRMHTVVHVCDQLSKGRWDWRSSELEETKSNVN